MCAYDVKVNFHLGKKTPKTYKSIREERTEDFFMCIFTNMKRGATGSEMKEGTQVSEVVEEHAAEA